MLSTIMARFHCNVQGRVSFPVLGARECPLCRGSRLPQIARFGVVAAPTEGERVGYLGARAAAARASATMATIARRTCSPVVHSSGKPRRTAARPAGLTAIISKP